MPDGPPRLRLLCEDAEANEDADRARHRRFEELARDGLIAGEELAELRRLHRQEAVRNRRQVGALALAADEDQVVVTLIRRGVRSAWARRQIAALWREDGPEPDPEPPAALAA